MEFNTPNKVFFGTQHKGIAACPKCKEYNPIYAISDDAEFKYFICYNCGNKYKAKEIERMNIFVLPDGQKGIYLLKEEAFTYPANDIIDLKHNTEILGDYLGANGNNRQIEHKTCYNFRDIKKGNFKVAAITCNQCESKKIILSSKILSCYEVMALDKFTCKTCEETFFIYRYLTPNLPLHRMFKVQSIKSGKKYWAVRPQHNLFVITGETTYKECNPDLFTILSN